ncbi:MAG TPA: PrgI family protein [Candidatus Acidoferrales bacterium]|nr:PrgI family protein [Candidatus Acidoferrales bacterium]
MDQHPIPQDVTGFQFKLIGTMTVKQFGYVASGVVMAVILYYLPLQSAFGILLKVLLVPLFGASGVVIAFVPIDGRPIDLMTSNFVKALFSPNQYIYHRQGRKLSFGDVVEVKPQSPKKTQQKVQTQINPRDTSKQLSQKEEKLRALLLNSRGIDKSDIDKRESAFLQSLTLPQTTPGVTQTTTTQITTHASPSISSQLPKPFPLPQQFPSPLPAIKQPVTPLPMTQQPIQKPQSSQNKQDELTKKETALEQALSQAKQEELSSNSPATHTVAEQKITLLSKQIQEVHAQKQQLENELVLLQTQLASQKTHASSNPIPNLQIQNIQDPQHVRVIPQNVTVKAGLPHVSDSPNVVVGIVKDPRGNILSNILVEVKDKDGNPVRAFKTNQLGQFASATPLSTGIYTMELEDPKKQQRFDVIKINANNQIMPPIEVISHDAREELRKQLFAN